MQSKPAVLGVDSKIPATESWLRKHKITYTGAIRHPFILSIRDGSIDFSSFKRWLGQDHIFVRAFVPFVASVLVKAWKESVNPSDMDVILGGMASLNDEIAWFKKEASRFHVSLTSVVPQKTNLEYCMYNIFYIFFSSGWFLESLMNPEVEYPVAITAFWVIEAVYQKSFSHCLEDDSRTPQELKETCQRWGNEGFGQYCKSLENIANRCLQTASDEVISKAEVVFLKVLEHEVDFWNMSRGEREAARG